jgi:hypothetical protein
MIFIFLCTIDTWEYLLLGENYAECITKIMALEYLAIDVDVLL